VDAESQPRKKLRRRRPLREALVEASANYSYDRNVELLRQSVARHGWPDPPYDVQLARWRAERAEREAAAATAATVAAPARTSEEAWLPRAALILALLGFFGYDRVHDAVRWIVEQVAR
jgi:hypothetical protein